jgi:hypothetical protein
MIEKLRIFRWSIATEGSDGLCDAPTLYSARSNPGRPRTTVITGVDLYWLPLGAGGHSVRLNGIAYEALAAWWQRRARRDLYHSALTVTVAGRLWTIEMAPIPDRNGAERGVVAEGPVGSRLLRRLRIFRYEVRRWPGGVIPDIAEAVASPVRLTDDAATARSLLQLVPEVPQLVWGRDESGCSDMWNSNSLVSWLIVCSGLDCDAVSPPTGGRAPGWEAGVAVARRQLSGRAA